MVPMFGQKCKHATDFQKNQKKTHKHRSSILMQRTHYMSIHHSIDTLMSLQQCTVFANTVVQYTILQIYIIDVFGGVTELNHSQTFFAFPILSMNELHTFLYSVKFFNLYLILEVSNYLGLSVISQRRENQCLCFLYGRCDPFILSCRMLPVT